MALSPQDLDLTEAQREPWQALVPVRKLGPTRRTDERRKSENAFHDPRCTVVAEATTATSLARTVQCFLRPLPSLRLPPSLVTRAAEATHAPSSPA